MKSFNLNESTYEENLAKSLTSYLDYSFYNDGGYSSTSGNLSQSSYPGYSEQKVWASNKKNWSWEDDVEVYSGNTLLSGYSVNYRDGLIIFPTNQNNIFAKYTYKKIEVLESTNIPFFRGESKKIDIYDGSYKANSIQTPTIVIELGSSSSQPYQLGSLYRRYNSEVLLNIFTKTDSACKKIMSILENQIDTNFRMFDFQTAYNSGNYPLTIQGFLMNKNSNYQYLSENYPWQYSSKCEIENAFQENITKIDNNLYHGTVRYDISTVSNMGFK